MDLTDRTGMRGATGDRANTVSKQHDYQSEALYVHLLRGKRWVNWLMSQRNRTARALSPRHPCGGGLGWRPAVIGKRSGGCRAAVRDPPP